MNFSVSHGKFLVKSSVEQGTKRKGMQDVRGIGYAYRFGYVDMRVFLM